MWPIIMGVFRTYAVYITWPVAAVIGVIGYNAEVFVRKDRNTPWRTQSIQDERAERKLEQLTEEDVLNVPLLKDKKDIPRTVLGRNDAVL